MALTPSERKRLADQVRVNEQYLYQCLTGRRDMDPVEAVRIERESGRAITRFDLCRKRGAQIWPELADQAAQPAAAPAAAVQEMVHSTGPM
jgi:DNA-binding transcriptional regulator YdaS (Cro superfamily)